MSSLTEFLLARISEDEALAQMPSDTQMEWEFTDDAEPAIIGVGWTVADSVQPTSAGHHIARWDPSRVLAECEAKRRIVGLIRERHPYFNWLQATDEGRGEDRIHGLACKILALPYADHPDFRADWL